MKLFKELHPVTTITLYLAGILAFLFLVVPTSNATLMVDPFDTPYVIEDSVIDGNAVTGDFITPGALGGHVRASVELVSSNQATGTARLEATGAGNLVFSTDTGTTGYASLFYGGGAFTTNGLISIDFTASGSNAFVLGLSESDLGFPFSATVWWANGTQSSTTDFTSLGFVFPGGVRVIGFDEFVGGVDFSDVSAFQFDINIGNSLAPAQVAVDLALVDISTNEVPAPGAGYLFGLGIGLLGLARVVRRK